MHNSGAISRLSHLSSFISLAAMRHLISDLFLNASFLAGFPLQSTPAANRQTANTMPAITSSAVMTASCGGERLDEVVIMDRRIDEELRSDQIAKPSLKNLLSLVDGTS